MTRDDVKTLTTLQKCLIDEALRDITIAQLRIIQGNQTGARIMLENAARKLAQAANT